MSWSSPAELEKQARLEIERSRDGLAARFERELAQLKEQYSASGLGKGSDLLSAIDDAANKHFASYASGTIDTLLDLLREAYNNVPSDAEEWSRQVFEAYLSTETVRLWQVLAKVAKDLDASTYDAPGRMNAALFRARKDLDIRLGRIRIQQAVATHGFVPAQAVVPTGVKNLPLKERLNQDLGSLLANDVQMSVLFIDLDGFKQVNDTKGHAEGDRCLESVVEVLQAAISGKGSLYRYGGDEFVAILPNFDINEAASTGERIRQAVVAACAGGDQPVTASIGAAESGGDLKTLESLLAAADIAMYASKRGGKNRVTKSPLVKHDPPSLLTAPTAALRCAELLIAEIERNVKLTGRQTRVENHLQSCWTA